MKCKNCGKEYSFKVYEIHREICKPKVAKKPAEARGEKPVTSSPTPKRGRPKKKAD